MNNRITAIVIAILFFIFWLATLYAGADHPPPLRFLFVIFLDFTASLLVYFRVSVYSEWYQTCKQNRIIRICCEGFFAGLTFALTTMVVSSLGMSLVLTKQSAILFAVVGMVGTGNAMSVYFLCILIPKLLNKFSWIH
jgi:hypothetical protein